MITEEALLLEQPSWIKKKKPKNVNKKIIYKIILKNNLTESQALQS